MHELSNPEAITPNFIFGLLPGWWLGKEIHDFGCAHGLIFPGTEKSREKGPLSTPQQWHNLLSRNGFVGVDIHWPDHYDDKNRLCSVMIASVEHHAPKPSDFQTKVYVVTNGSIVQQEVGQRIKVRLAELGNLESQIVEIHEIASQNLDHGHCIFLPELQSPVFLDMTEMFFSTLKKILYSNSMVLWATEASDNSAVGPSSGIVPGFARTIRTENPTLKFVTVSLERGDDTEKVVDHIVRVYRASATSCSTKYESEYEERNGILYINRVVEAGYLSQAVLFRPDTNESSLQSLGQEPHRRLALRVLSPGLLDTLAFADDTSSLGVLASDEIEVEIKASGLGFRDILIASGLYRDTSFGLEYAGIVMNAGRQAANRVGDRVYGWTHGSIKTHARCKDMTSLRIPDRMSFTTAVAFLVGHCTAYHSLVNVARLRRYESILIHSAAGATGQAAIQMAKQFDAEIYATVGTLEKKSLLTEVYGIPQDHIFSSRTLSFQKGIKRMTHGRGVDVVLNSLTDEALHASIKSLAAFGRFVEYGRTNSGDISLATFPSNMTYATVDLFYSLRHNPELIRDLMRLTRPFIDSAAFIPPKPLHVYKSSRLEDAFRYMQGGKNSGKVAIELNKEDMVHVSI